MEKLRRQLEDLMQWEPTGDLGIMVKTECLQFMGMEAGFPDIANDVMVIETEKGDVRFALNTIADIARYERDYGNVIENGYRIRLVDDTVVELFETREVEGDE